MIHDVWSDRETFRRREFRPGLNIVLVRRGDSSTDTQKRNAAGKSSLVDIVHFLFGGDREAKSPLSADELANDTYYMRADVGGALVTVSRNYNERGRVTIVEGDTSRWPVQPDMDEAGTISMSVGAWSDLLGQLYFGLPPASNIPKRSQLSFSARSFRISLGAQRRAATRIGANSSRSKSQFNGKWLLRR